MITGKNAVLHSNGGRRKGKETIVTWKEAAQLQPILPGVFKGQIFVCQENPKIEIFAKNLQICKCCSTPQNSINQEKQA